MRDVPASLLPFSRVCDSQDCGISGLPELGTVIKTRHSKWRIFFRNTMEKG